jgi:hypothetical protein
MLHLSLCTAICRWVVYTNRVINHGSSSYSSIRRSFVLPVSQKGGKKMDPRNFDELTKILATNTSRRQALKTILASVVGGALGLSGIDAALAEPGCYRDHYPCRYNNDCCSNHCSHGYCSGHNCYEYNHPCRYNNDCCSNNCLDGRCGR